MGGQCDKQKMGGKQKPVDFASPLDDFVPF